MPLVVNPRRLSTAAPNWSTDPTLKGTFDVTNVSFDEATRDVAYSSIYLSGEEKSELAESGTPFTIYEIVVDSANSFGPRWVLSIDLEGTERKLGLNCNGRRDQLMKALKPRTDSGAAIGPVCLERRALKGGQTVWEIVSATAASAVPEQRGDPDIPW